MSSFLKVMLALLLTLPLGAYITGTLVASQADMPTQRETVVIEQGPSDEATTPSATPTPRKTPRPKPPRERDDSDDSDDSDDRDSDDRDRDDVRVVRPTPRDVDDDWDDDVDDDSDDASDDGDDDS